jgi:hypothetical protein
MRVPAAQEARMKTFLAIYTGSPASMDAWKALDADTRAARERAGIDAWKQWVAANAGALVETGGPLGRTKRVSTAGIADIRNQMAAWTVVRAETHEAAAALFTGHPHFTVFPGDGVEVMECLPIPEG